MGWSCTDEAYKVIETWSDACMQQTGTSNDFVDTRGNRYFWEASRTEHNDGAITGTVWKQLNNGNCLKSGTFRIEGNGTVTRAPKFLKDCGHGNIRI